MDKMGYSRNIIINIFLIIIAFILGGTGLGIVYKNSGDLASLIGGFALIGVAVAIVYKIIEDE